MSWNLKRTTQCKKCPWRKDVNPRDIPNGYCEIKHQNLADTIAAPQLDIAALWRGGAMRVMACHELEDAHCIGWVHNQVGEGNNIPLRFRMLDCDNFHAIRLVGEQHETFEDTLPKGIKV